MPDKWPLANGNWSNAANWNGGTKPVAGDDVFADGRTVTIDEDITVASIRNTQRSGGTANGSFTLTTSRIINANIIAGNGNSQSCVYVNTTGISLTVNGNITAGSNSDAHGINIDNLATLNVNGNIFGGTGGTRPVGVFVVRQTNVNVVGNVTAGSSSNAHAIQANGNNTITITVTGAVTGGSGGSATGIRNEGNVTIIVNGNVNGGSGASGIGINNVTTGLVTVNGNVTGGAGSNSFGVNNGATGTVLVTGDATGGSGSTAYGANNTSTGLIRVYGSAIGNDHGLGYSTNNGTPGVFGFGTNIGVTQATTTVRGIRYGAKGQSPTAGLVQLDITNLANSSARFRTEPNSFTEYTFGPPENIGGQPTPSDVRLGVIYNFGNRTGTCAVPPANSTAFGVPVDNTIGTAVITEAGLTTLLQQALSPNAAVAVERSIDDEKAITFSWPVSGATIIGEKSIDNGAYSTVAGAIAFLRTESGRHYYTLAYNAADRVDQEATIRYKMTDGTYTKYFNLRLVPPGITPEQIQTQLENEFEAIPNNVRTELSPELNIVNNIPDSFEAIANQIDATQTVIIDAIDNIVIDNTAIAQAVRVELTDELDIINNIPDSFDAISTQIDGISTIVYVSPAAFTSPGKVTGRTLRPYYKDTSRLGPIGIADSTRTPIDLSAFDGDLYVSVMNSDTLEVLMYDDDPHYVTSNLYIDPSPESVGVLEAPLCWALRRISNNQTLMEGPWEVQFAAYRTT